VIFEILLEYGIYDEMVVAVDVAVAVDFDVVDVYNALYSSI
jgi:hypothetical protein